MLLRVTVRVHDFGGEKVQRALNFTIEYLLKCVRERSLDDSADHLDQMRSDEVGDPGAVLHLADRVSDVFPDYEVVHAVPATKRPKLERGVKPEPTASSVKRNKPQVLTSVAGQQHRGCK